jgi:hypothetical protein
MERSGEAMPVTITFGETTSNGWYIVQVETEEDKFALGGGGPRSGLIRINDDGDLEIIVAGSAGSDAPKDFSDEQRSRHVFYKATASSVT